MALFVLWGALGGALAELAARYCLLAIRPSLIATFYLNVEAIWLGPLVNVPVFLLMVGATYAGLRAFRPRLVLPGLVFVSVGMALFEVALITGRVHPAALAVLAAGGATVASGIATRLPAMTLRLVRITTAIMAAVAIGGGVAQKALATQREKHAIASLASAPSSAPNIVLLILDTVRAIELGTYGNARSVSPSLDSLVRNGIRFDNAISTAPWTLPSHASILTGRYPHELSTGWTQSYDGRYPLISEVVRQKGYSTGAFVGNLVFLTKRWGLSRGFIHYEDYQHDHSMIATGSTLTRLLLTWWNGLSSHRVVINRTSAAVLRDRFSAWQKGLGGRPFFAFLNLFDAHAPYTAPAPFDTLFLGRHPRFFDINNFRQRDSLENAELRAGYDQALASLDHQVGELLDDLRRRGVLQRTFVIITADHGEEFGEHGFSGHGGSVHSTQTHVPLIVIPPGWQGSRHVPDFVTLRDVAATIAEVAGVAPGAVPGRTLSSYWESADTAPAMEPSPILSEVSGHPKLKPWYPLFNGSLRSLIIGRLHFIAQEGGREFLYDIVADPLELRELSRNPAYADSLPRLRAAMTGAFTPRDH